MGGDGSGTTSSGGTGRSEKSGADEAVASGDEVDEAMAMANEGGARGGASSGGRLQRGPRRRGSGKSAAATTRVERYQNARDAKRDEDDDAWMPPPERPAGRGGLYRHRRGLRCATHAGRRGATAGGIAAAGEATAVRCTRAAGARQWGGLGATARSWRVVASAAPEEGRDGR